MFHIERASSGAAFIAISTVSIILAYFAFLTLLVPSAQALTTTPTTMNFQGRLADSTGQIMPDGLYNMEFALFTVGSGGSSVWNETRENNGTDYRVQVTNGLFSTKLGQVSPLTASLFASGSLYFEITMATPATATCSTASCATWESPMTPRHQMATSAYAYNAETLDGYDSSDFAAASGSANYIQNGSTPQTANFNITGTGTAGIIQAATFDTATAVALNIGTTGTPNTTQINLNQSTVLAAGKSITITGSGTRPASPTEGMVYYDTTTKQLLTYSNGKWQSDSKTATFVVAANNSSQAAKDAAQYVADGEDSAGAGIGTLDGDQIQINDALTAAAAANGGTVYLAAGTYTVDGSITIPNNVTLAGSGASTIIQFGSFGVTATSIDMIVNTDTSTGTGIVIRDLKLDGRKTSNISGTTRGIYLNQMGDGTGSSSRKGATVTNIWAKSFRNEAVYLTNSENNSITNSNFVDNNSNNIYLTTSSLSNTISGNNIQAGTIGVSISSSSDGNTITGNTIRATTANGIYVASADTTVSSNNLDSTGTIGIYAAAGANYATIVSNTIVQSAGNTAISLNTAGYGTVTGNIIRDGATGISMSLSSTNSITGNTIRDTTARAIYTNTAGPANITGNNLYNNTVGVEISSTSSRMNITGNVINGSGGSTDNNAIMISSATDNIITSNAIVDSSCTSTCYAINITDAASARNYLADNIFNMGSIFVHASNTTTTLASQSLAVNGGQLTTRAANSAAAFQVQNATGVNMLNVNTSNNLIQIGSATTDATANLFILDSYNSGTDPTGYNGAMYYNTNLNKFRCYQADAWGDCAGAGGSGANTSLSNIASTNLSAPLNVTSGNLTLQTTTSGDINLDAVGLLNISSATLVDPVSDSANLFKIQDASALTLLNVNSNDTEVGVVDSGLTGTLGYTAQGPSTDSGDRNYMNATKVVTGSAGGTLDSISFYVGNVSSSPNNVAQVALYSDNNGVPDSRLAYTGDQVLTGNSLNTTGISYTLAANTTYWIVYNTQALNDTYNNLKYDAANYGYPCRYVAQTYGTWPASWSGGTACDSNWTFSMYANISYPSRYTLKVADDSTALLGNVSISTGQLNIDWTGGANGADDTTGGLIIGRQGGLNMGIDYNSIEARNNNSNATLYLNSSGGNIELGASSQIYLSGQSGASCSLTTSWSCTSDERLKNIQGTVSDNIAKLMQLKPVYYSWKSDATQDLQIGLLAQNVRAQYPELVQTDKNGTLSLNYQGLVSPIIGAFQEQQREIETIRNMISSLQSTTNILTSGSYAAINVSGPAKVGSLTVMDDATIHGELTVGTIKTGTITVNGHIVTAGNTPAIEAGYALGVMDVNSGIDAPEVTITGNDTSGTITIKSGADTVSGVLSKVTFAKAFGAKPQVVFSPANKQSAALEAYYDMAASSKQSFTLRTSEAPAPGQTYVFTYFVVQ